MQLSDKTWAGIKDFLLTGTGIWIIVSQALSVHPSSILLVVAMGLTVPSVYDHAKSVISGPSQPSKPPAEPSSNGSPTITGTSASSSSAPRSSAARSPYSSREIEELDKP